MRIALLSYRSKPHVGGQGVYVRNLSRELVRLGHRVEVFSGQPYPDLDPGVELTEVPSLDLYREPDPFRTPHWREFRDLVDVLEVGTMWTAGFPEPLTFTLRAAKILRERAGEFDVVHDNQSLGYGLLALQRAGLPLVATWTEVEELFGEERTYCHTFYGLGDGSALAFFQFADPADQERFGPKMPKSPFTHIALKVTEGVQEAIATRLSAEQWDPEQTYVLDHGYCRSLYTRDPNGLLLEFTVDASNVDELNRTRLSTAHEDLRRWLNGDHTPNNDVR